MLTAKEKFFRRLSRTRQKISGSPSSPRLCLKKSLKYLYAQVVDDSSFKTVASFTTHSDDFKEFKSKKNKQIASKFGEHVGKKLIEAGVKRVVFDRRGYKYHGVVKEFADGVRKSGVVF